MIEEKPSSGLYNSKSFCKHTDSIQISYFAEADIHYVIR